MIDLLHIVINFVHILMLETCKQNGGLRWNAIIHVLHMTMEFHSLH